MSAAPLPGREINRGEPATTVSALVPVVDKPATLNGLDDNMQRCSNGSRTAWRDRQSVCRDFFACRAALELRNKPNIAIAVLRQKKS